MEPVTFNLHGCVYKLSTRGTSITTRVGRHRITLTSPLSNKGRMRFHVYNLDYSRATIGSGQAANIEQAHLKALLVVNGLSTWDIEVFLGSVSNGG